MTLGKHVFMGVKTQFLMPAFNIFLAFTLAMHVDIMLSLFIFLDALRIIWILAVINLNNQKRENQKTSKNQPYQWIKRCVMVAHAVNLPYSFNM